ncbi:MAG TPA: alpha/beta hydrolase [Thermoanaerobaculia bacterium]|nr:alpha/beta hydrolase [Thermoanaerobaculia bacterium]
MEREDPEALKPILPMRIVLTVPGMDRAAVQKGLVYKTDGGAELRMDVYTPPDRKAGEALPAVFFVHGGPIPPNLRTEPTDWGIFVSHGQLAAASGFVGVTFNHRLHGMDQYGTAASDVEDAIRHVRENAEALGVDADRIAVWVFSGGGPLLASFLADPPPFVRGFVSYYGLLDFEDEALKRFSPVESLRAREDGNVPPVFVARVAIDNPAINRSVGLFVQEAFAKNVPLTVLTHPTGRHGFDAMDDDERSREILRATVGFLSERFAGGPGVAIG